MTASWLALVALSCSACTAYQPGSFRGPHGVFRGQRRTVGCLDVAVAAGKDVRSGGSTAVYTFANRCDVPVVVDLTTVHAVGKDESDRIVPLRLRDPRGEVRALALEARTFGIERLEYQPALLADWAANDRALATLCLDVASIERRRVEDWPPWTDGGDLGPLPHHGHHGHHGHAAVPAVCVKP